MDVSKNRLRHLKTTTYEDIDRYLKESEYKYIIIAGGVVGNRAAYTNPHDTYNTNLRLSLSVVDTIIRYKLEAKLLVFNSIYMSGETSTQAAPIFDPRKVIMPETTYGLSCLHLYQYINSLLLFHFLSNQVPKISLC